MPDVTVSLDHYATAQEADAVQEAFRASGIVADVRISQPPAPEPDRPPEEQIGNGFLWSVLAELRVPVIAFISALAVKGAGDAYDGLRSLVTRLWDSRRAAQPPDGYVEFGDPDGTRLLIGEVAEDAFEKLREMEPQELRGKRWRWDEQSREWVEY